uniref:Pleckstrin homology domain-containing family J member 1 isoform X2 n=1 Tax=Pogona vitticeps TaxID=103695 RepID=A0ABM5ELY8_9SAUR
MDGPRGSGEEAPGEAGGQLPLLFPDRRRRAYRRVTAGTLQDQPRKWKCFFYQFFQCGETLKNRRLEIPWQPPADSSNAVGTEVSSPCLEKKIVKKKIKGIRWGDLVALGQQVFSRNQRGSTTLSVTQTSSARSGSRSSGGPVMNL